MESVLIAGHRGMDALGLMLAEMPHMMGYYTGKVYNGHTIRPQGDGWLLVLRAVDRGEHLVTFLGAPDLLILYRQLWVGLVKGGLTWATDKYA